MTRVVYKYEVPVDDEWHEIRTPGTATFLHVGNQGGHGVQLWAEVAKVNLGVAVRKVRVFGTGQNIPDGAIYVGTTMAGPFVWHVYAEPAA
jgi:hypothetical protein